MMSDLYRSGDGFMLSTSTLSIRTYVCQATSSKRDASRGGVFERGKVGRLDHKLRARGKLRMMRQQKGINFDRQNLSLLSEVVSYSPVPYFTKSIGLTAVISCQSEIFHHQSLRQPPLDHYPEHEPLPVPEPHQQAPHPRSQSHSF